MPDAEQQPAGDPAQQPEAAASNAQVSADIAEQVTFDTTTAVSQDGQDQQGGPETPTASAQQQVQEQSQQALQLAQQQPQELQQQPRTWLKLFLGHVPADYAHCR